MGAPSGGAALDRIENGRELGGFDAIERLCGKVRPEMPIENALAFIAGYRPLFWTMDTVIALQRLTEGDPRRFWFVLHLDLKLTCFGADGAQSDIRVVANTDPAAPTLLPHRH